MVARPHAQGRPPRQPVHCSEDWILKLVALVACDILIHFLRGPTVGDSSGLWQYGVRAAQASAEFLNRTAIGRAARVS